jgi:hypothetical protein
MESHALCGTKSTTMAETAFASHIGPLREIGSPGGCFMIELEHRLGLKGLPTAKCTDHGLVLRPEPVSANATLTVTWSCPICTAEHSTPLKKTSKRARAAASPPEA